MSGPAVVFGQFTLTVGAKLLIGFCATVTVKMRINVNSVWRVSCQRRVRIRSGVVINIEGAYLTAAMMR
jgi:hypothetical protein